MFTNLRQNLFDTVNKTKNSNVVENTFQKIHTELFFLSLYLFTTVA